MSVFTCINIGVQLASLVNGPVLIKKLEALDWCQRLAVIDAPERFWARQDWPSEHHDLVAAVVGESAITD